MSEDVNASVKFYCERLGFQMLMGLPFDSEQPVHQLSDKTLLQFAMLQRESAMLMFQHRRSLESETPSFGDLPLAASATFYMEVNDLDGLLAGLGNDIVQVLPERVTFYGMREIWIRDNNGYVLTLAEKAA